MSDLSRNFKINIEPTINSGQVFLWEKIDKKWYGIDGDRVLVLENEQKFEKNMRYESSFFRFDDDLLEISKELEKDKNVKNALKLYPDLRLTRQNPFQCYVSFIASSNSNIPNIKLRLKNLCQMFGKRKTTSFEIFQSKRNTSMVRNI